MRWTSKWPTIVICVWVLLHVAEAEECGNRKFASGIRTKEVGLGGNKMITINGCGFSKDQSQFGQGGNEVRLVGDDGENHLCGKHVDKCTEKQLTCYTPRGLKPDKPYRISLKIDGEQWNDTEICADCTVTAKREFTPTIDLMTQSGPPGQLIQWYGRMITERYGTNTNISKNGREDRILRAWAGGKELELKNGSSIEDHFYKLSLDNSTTDYGWMGGLPKTEDVGIINVTYILEGNFGGSLEDARLLRVHRNDGIYMYMLYDEIIGISPSNCGAGCYLRIDGKHFDDESSGYSKPEVYVGGQPCKILSVVRNSHLTCEMPSLPETPLELYAGGLGVNTDLWQDQGAASDDDIRKTTAAPAKTVHTSDAHYCSDDSSMDSLRSSGIFVAAVTGPYRFGLNSTKSGSIFLNGTLVATSSGGTWTDSDSTYNIRADDWNEIVVVARGGEDSCITARALQYTTEVTSQMSGQSMPETQAIKLTSQVDLETTTMEFNNFASSVPTSEKQRVCIKRGDLQLHLLGLNTGSVDFDSDAIQTALNERPFLGKAENFTVQSYNDTCVDITFNSDRGDFPAFTCGPNCQISVEELQKGQPDNGKMALMLNGVHSPVFSFTDNITEFTDRLKGALETMFSAICPSMFEDKNAVFLESFEMSNNAVTDFPPFCGRQSRKGAWIPLFSGKRSVIDLKGNLICFAVNGMDNTDIYVQYVRGRVEADTEDPKPRWRKVPFAAVPSETPGWQYGCLDLKTTIKDHGGNSEYSDFDFLQVIVQQIDKTVPFYADAVQLVGADSAAVIWHAQQTKINGTMSGLRREPASPNPDETILIKSVKVESVGTGGKTYQVELEPHDCGHNFAMITAANSETTTTGSDIITSTLSEGSASITIERTKHASPHIHGQFTLRFNGIQATFEGNMTDANISKRMSEEWSSMMGQQVAVARTRSSTCANMDIRVDMIDVGGDQPEMEVVSETLKPDSAAVTVETIQDGHLNHEPISPSYMRTRHTTPQVQVVMNSVMSKCGIEDCSFVHDQSVVPQVNSIDKTSGAPGTTLAISGSQFSSVPEENHVVIGDTECQVLSATTTQLTCKVGNGAAGTAAVKVKVINTGDSTGSVTFTYAAGVAEIVPVEDGIGGGNNMTVTGYGFSKDTVVKIGSELVCSVIEPVLPYQITCVIPTYVDGQPAGGDYPLQVQVFAHADDLNPMEPTPTFTYKTSVTPVITSLNIDGELTTEGGQQIIIQGTNFGTVGHVFMASIEATVKSFGDTEIIVETPAGLPVEETILLEAWTIRGDTKYLAVKYDDVEATKRRRKRAGIKKPTGEQNMGQIPLRYSSVCPNGGSLYGGTRITIEGEGFGTDEKVVKVWVDETECTVEQVTKTSIVCQIQSTVKTHHINNEGTTLLGTYLAFNEKNAIIKVGDVIQWTWTTPSYYSGIVHTIQEVTADGTNLIKPSGIAAPGPPSRVGTFQHTFIKPGVYFFSSGFVDRHQNRFYNGKVDVQPRDAATFAEIKVEVGNKQAIFMSAGTSGSCTASSSLKQTCTLASPADGLFAFDPCLTPSVSKRSFTPAYPTTLPQFIAHGEDVTFTGDQFTISQPQPSGFIGQCACDYKSHGSGEFLCTPSDSCFLKIDFALQEVGVQLLPYGFAFVDIENAVDRQMAVVPTITDFNPKTGSKQGGTLVTIQGHGFSNNYVVEFGGIKANQLSPDSWVYKTPAGSSAVTAVALAMKTDGPAAVCKITPCNFVYATSQTPAVTAATLSGNTVTFTGDNFQSDMAIEIGGKQCAPVTFTSDTEVSCTLNGLPATSDIAMTSTSLGDASIPSSVSLSSSPAVSPPLYPEVGSIHGGTRVTIPGTGFLGATTISGTDCTCDLDIVSSTTEQLICTTRACAAGTDNFQVTSNGVDAASTLAFDFSLAQTPDINFSETEGSEGTVLNIAGTNLGSSSAGVEVWFDDDPDGCDVTNVDLAGGSITCSVGEHASGQYKVRYRTSELGFSNSVNFDYTFLPVSVFPTSGDVNGGQRVTIPGSGFTQQLQVDIGGSPCTPLEVTSTEYICETSPGAGTNTYDVMMWEDENLKKVAGQYTYVADFGPFVTSIDPARGGTAGGTHVSIVGGRFSGGQLKVTIAGSPCDVLKSDDTNIECVTSAHAGTVLAPVEVAVGSSKTTSSDDFHYANFWSNPSTWGNGPLPQEGEIVAIDSDNDVYLDTDTPVLAFLLIQGGRLIFSDTTDIELHAEYILITDGGVLQVGTELNPFQHNAQIMMHGHIYSPELPIYGAKVLAVRQGLLDMHGQGPTNTWSVLERTVRTGDTEIFLQHDITGWNVGDSVVIATTGPGTSDSIAQTEVHTIADVSTSGDEWKITLEMPLEYTHFGETETHGGVDIDIRAEVGLLTRNVRFLGSRNENWSSAIPACEEGFDPGEFKTQTCFQGRLGPETGTDEFGGHILVHPPEPQVMKQETIARIENVEFNYVGQAFRLGRYPIHFHICGNVSQSYVKSNAIQQTFNRMVNIHASNYLPVLGNVGYNVMGGAIFLEDHIEIGNILEHNFLSFVRASTSLLNEDITPAGFWITHPNNIVRYNAVAGGTHFGYWFFFQEHPTGPSFDENICPYKEIFGVFEFNRAHSLGWFGIWIFPEYFPMKDGSCQDWSNPVLAIIRGLVVYNSDKCAESVDVGSVQYIDCVFFQCDKAGYEGKTIRNTHRSDCEQGPMVKNSLFVGRADNPELRVNNEAYTKAAIILPFFDGFFVIGCKFYNFELVFQVTSIDGICGKYCNGFTVNFYDLTFNNVIILIKNRWEHELLINDATGSLSGTGVPQLHLPGTSTSIPSTCVIAQRTDGIKVYDENHVEGYFCPPDTTNFVRLSWNNVKPASSIGSRAKLVSSDNKIIYGPFADKRITHKDGYMVILKSCETYFLTYETYVIPTNMSWTGMIYNLAAATEVGQCYAIILQFPIDALPHVVSIDNGKTRPDRETSIFTLADAPNLPLGAWYYDPDNGLIGILIKAEGDLPYEKKCAGTTTTRFTDVAIDLLVYRCYFKDCIVPLPPSMQPLDDRRPDIYQRWQDMIWASTTDEGGQTVFETVADGSSIDSLMDGDNVIIHEFIDEDTECWLVVDKESIAAGPLKRLGTVTIYGVFEIDYLSGGVTFTLEFNFLIVYGRFISGWPDDPMLSPLIMTVHGIAGGPVYPQDSGATVGSKAIAVYGAFDAHGPSVGDPWTQLDETAESGAIKIKVTGDVSSWQPGDTVIITSTSHAKHELEERLIASILGKEITLTQALLYRHIVKQERTLAAYVGLKTRRLSIVGKDNGDQFGGRILVSSTQQDGETYSGVARLSYVALRNMGQFGYTESLDLRSALAFNQLGDPHVGRPLPYVMNCSFYDLANTAVSAVGSSQVTVEGSLVYGAVGHGIRTETAFTSLLRNLIVDSKARALWQGRFDAKNLEVDAGIYAIGATDFSMRDNVVAGSDQAGYTVLESSDSEQCNHNAAIGNLIGWVFFPSYGGLGTRHKICGYTFWLNCYYGIYYQASEDLLVKDNYFEENGVGLFPFIIGPSIRDHIVGDNRVTVESNFFKGSGGECTSCLGTDEPYKRLLSLAQPKLPGGVKFGMQFTTFSTGSNKAPKKPFANIMAYNTIAGVTELKGNTFQNFEGTCSVALGDNPGNDDMNHLVVAESSTVLPSVSDVPIEALIYYTTPNVGKINPSDCVDMDCDAMKKQLLYDSDGSLLGKIGTVIPDSAFEWGGDPRRGLGDYRIPKSLLADPQTGNPVSVDSFGRYKGIYRNEKCEAVAESRHRMYVCEDYYNHLVIESMDADTEDRRLSPVAVVVDNYIDLINGPQDHGWCNGYTCQERISTFHAILPPLLISGKAVEIHFSSTNPEETRFFMLNAAADSCVLICVFYGAPYRIDTHAHDGNTFQYVVPNNGLYSDQSFSFLPGLPSDFMPSCDSNPSHGSNYINRDLKRVCFILRGNAPVDLRKIDQIMLSFGYPSMTTAEFFSTNLIPNIAALLGVDLGLVRLVDVVSETTTQRRRKRSEGGVIVTIEVGPPPTGDPAFAEQMAPKASEMMDDCQSGAIADILDTDGLTCDEIAFKEVSYIPEVPAGLRFEQAIGAKHEGVPFSTQPRLRAYDSNGNAIGHLGTVEYPWAMTAVHRNGTGHPRAVLSGTLTIKSHNGWFNFTDLAISHAGSGYIIDFYISSPSGHENLTITSDAIGVTGRPLTAGVYSMTSGHILQNSVFTLTLDLRDETTGEVIADIGWRDHEFDVTCNLTVAMDTWTLGGALSQTFVISDSGRATFSDLTFSGYGLLYIGCKVESTPAEYEFYSYHEAVVVTPSQQALTVDATNIVTLRFNVDYNTYLASKMAEYQLLQAITYKLGLAYSDIIISAAALNEGSIIVTLTIEGQSVNVTSMTQLLCSDITDGSTVTVGGTTLTFDAYMMVDGTDYYSTCTAGDDDDDKGLHAGFIALIAVGAALIIGLIILFLVWVFKIRPRSKTHGIRRWKVNEYAGEKASEGAEDRNSNTRYGGGFYYIDNGRTVFMAGQSSKLANLSEVYRPKSAAPLSTLYDDGGLPIRRSPHPAFKVESVLETDRSVTPSRSPRPPFRLQPMLEADRPVTPSDINRAITPTE